MYCLPVVSGRGLQGACFPPEFELNLVDSAKLALSQFFPVVFKFIFIKMSKSLQTALSGSIPSPVRCCHVVKFQKAKKLSSVISP